MLTRPTASARSDQAARLEDVDAARGAEADDVREADPGAFDLAVAGLAAKVVADLPDVGDAGRRDRVALRLEAARDVDRGRAVAPRRTRLEEVDRAALLAQHEVVVVDELGGGEAVVQLDEVEVGRADAGRFVGLLGRAAGQRVDVREHLARFLPRVGGEHGRRDLHRAALLLEAAASSASSRRRRPRPRRRRSSRSTSAACSGRRSSRRS